LFGTPEGVFFQSLVCCGERRQVAAATAGETPALRLLKTIITSTTAQHHRTRGYDSLLRMWARVTVNG
jgi:hypothetical protein